MAHKFGDESPILASLNSDDETDLSNMPIKDFLEHLVKDLQVQDSASISRIMNLQSNFTDNFYYNTNQLVNL